MEWNNGMVLEFLEAYATEPTIWDLRNEDHKRKSLVQAAWQRVLSRLDWDCTIDDLKKKRDSLMAYYRIHWNKARQCKTTNGAEGTQDYATTWFAFETMNRFLGEIYGFDIEVNLKLLLLLNKLIPIITLLQIFFQRPPMCIRNMREGTWIIPPIPSNYR